MSLKPILRASFIFSILISSSQAWAQITREEQAAVAQDLQYREDTAEVEALAARYASALAAQNCDAVRAALRETEEKFNSVVASVLGPDSYVKKISPGRPIARSTAEGLAQDTEKLKRTHNELEAFLRSKNCVYDVVTPPSPGNPVAETTEQASASPTTQSRPAPGGCDIFPVAVRIQRLSAPAAAIVAWDKERVAYHARVTACGNNTGCLAQESAVTRTFLAKLGPLTQNLLATYDSVCGVPSDLAGFPTTVQNLVANRPASGPYSKQANSNPPIGGLSTNTPAPAGPGTVSSAPAKPPLPGGVALPGNPVAPPATGGGTRSEPKTAGGAAVTPPSVPPVAPPGDSQVKPPVAPPNAPTSTPVGTDMPGLTTAEKPPVARAQPALPPLPAPPPSTPTTTFTPPPPIGGGIARAPEGGMIVDVAKEFTDRIPGSICGPDITENVFAVLRAMKTMYDANPRKREEACRALIDPQTGGSAWDILEMAPRTSGTWFTGISSGLCAIPRPACSASVEFLGTCYHAQVVNYVQWGMLTSLCGGAYPAIGSALHRVRNLAGAPLTAPTDPQLRMVDVGAEYKEALDSNPNPDIGDNSEIRKKHIARSKFIARNELACNLSCKLDAGRQKMLKEMTFRFKWTGLNEPERDERYDGRTGR